MTCEHCKHWLPNTHKAGWGFCRRYPPMFRVHTDRISQWAESNPEHPQTPVFDSCGEFKDRNQPEVKRGRPTKK